MSNLDNFNLILTPQELGESDDITCRDFSLSVKGKYLFQNTDLVLVKGKRYGLVGRNGDGKSTLLLHLWKKKIPVSPKLNVFMVEQEIGVEFASLSVLESVLHANPQLVECKKKLEILTNLDRDLTTTEYKEFQSLHDSIEKLDLYKSEPKVKQILAGLGFSPDQLQLPTETFSGGWKMRISLARAIFMEPHILLLDEPTNHLDLDAVIWLENYLLKWRKTLVVISHDQDFLDEICTDIYHIRRQKLNHYRGNYSDFRHQLDQQLQQEQKEWNKYQKSAKQNTGKGKKQKPKQNNKKSKITNLSQHTQISPPPRPERYLIDFTFPETDDLFSEGQTLISLQGVDFAYPKQPVIFRNLDLKVNMGDRLCLVGPNGVGKSTIFHLLTGTLEPQKGKVYRETKCRTAVYNQHFIDALDHVDTPVNHLQGVDNNLDTQSLRACLGKFGLRGDKHLIPISQLSGGQKARVQFASISLQCPDLILLDEPTNHLDLESIDALIDSINQFTGAVVLISHDTRLITKAKTQLVICGSQDKENTIGCKHFQGDLEDYRNLILAS